MLDNIEEKTDDNIPMPTYFCFLALLAFKIFAEEQVDVAIMEVGIGGKYDATDVFKYCICFVLEAKMWRPDKEVQTIRDSHFSTARIISLSIPLFHVNDFSKSRHQ